MLDVHWVQEKISNNSATLAYSNEDLELLEKHSPCQYATRPECHVDAGAEK